MDVPWFVPTSSLPEVAGDAAVLVDPRNVKHISAQLAHVLESPLVRADMKERGRARALDFPWERTARETIEVYRRVVNS